MKKILCMFMALIMSTGIIGVSPIIVLANDTECTGAELTYGNISIRDMTEAEKKDLETGKINPIEVDDINTYIASIPSGKYNILNSVSEYTPMQTFGLSDIASKYIAVDPIPVPPVKINCQFNYTSAKNKKGKYYFTSISKIKTWLSGVQVPVGYTWSQKGSNYSLSNGKKTATISVNGVMATHIILKGVGKILEQNMSYSFNFNARK